MSSSDPYKPQIPPPVRKQSSALCDRIPRRAPPKTLGPALTGNDLVTQLANKLKKTQEENQNLKILLKRANDENMNLRDKLASVGFDSATAEENVAAIQEMRRYAAKLESQIYNLEKFLESQGLVYVETDNEESTNSQAQTLEQKEELLAKDYDRIKQQIDELKRQPFNPPAREILHERILKLNQISSAKPELTKVEGQIHSFNDRERIKVRFYPDGIFVRGGPFRRYTEDEGARNFVIDIEQGFLPSEWQAMYPQGV